MTRCRTYAESQVVELLRSRLQRSLDSREERPSRKESSCPHFRRQLRRIRLRSGSIRFLLFIAGLGGLLYGIDVGIIAGALPYLKDTSAVLDAQKLSFIVAAVLLGSVIAAFCRDAG